MGRQRLHPYLDVYLSDAEIKNLRKGYSVRQQVNGMKVCIKHGAKDRKTQKEIDRLKARIKELEGAKKEVTT